MTTTKLTEAQAADIILTEGELTHNEAAEKHGVSYGSVRAIRYGNRWPGLRERLEDMDYRIKLFDQFVAEDQEVEDLL